MSTSQKQEVISSLQDQLQSEEARDAQFAQLQEELLSLSKRYQAQQSEQKTELENRNLQIWILDDKYQQLKDEFANVQRDKAQEDREAERTRVDIKAKKIELEARDRELVEIKEESGTIESEKQEAVLREEALRNEGERLKEELEKEK